MKGRFDLGKEARRQSRLAAQPSRTKVVQDKRRKKLKHKGRQYETDN